MKFLLDHDVPESIRYVLEELGHAVHVLRDVLPVETPDSAVLAYAVSNQLILITCNRDDFLLLSAGCEHHGLIILVRRRNRVEERAALLRLLLRAGEAGIYGNVNFA